jgi:hypothetical protein
MIMYNIGHSILDEEDDAYCRVKVRRLPRVLPGVENTNVYASVSVNGTWKTGSKWMKATEHR